MEICDLRLLSSETVEDVDMFLYKLSKFGVFCYSNIK